MLDCHGLRYHEFIPSVTHVRVWMSGYVQVDLREEEAKSLYQQLDVDRDGALGAEDLLRGAPTLGGHWRAMYYYVLICLLAT